nr:RNA-directed DNA polymerase, eukaryota [Tanacetum cinerariifolium]
MGDYSWHVVKRKKHGYYFNNGQHSSDDQARYRSNEDDVCRISTSIYVTNFPDTFSAKYLFQTCKQYGHVIDSFIPDKRSKQGKRFGFVRFINVFNVDRLVANLCTIWVNRFKFQANLACFQRASMNDKKVHVKKNDKPSRGAYMHSRKEIGGNHDSKSYVNVVMSHEKSSLRESDVNTKALKPALVLDDSYENDFDVTLSLTGKLKEFGSLPNLNKILVEEGFHDIFIRYLGGFWVLQQFSSKLSLENFKQHVSANSWFTKIHQASNSFFVDERVVWIDIEGVPLCAWTQNTFARIASIWGSLLYEEDVKSPHFHHKRLCIKTSIQDTIFDSIKILVKGTSFLIWAKELTGWAPSYNDEGDSDTDDESVNSQHASSLKEENLDKHNDEEEVQETEKKPVISSEISNGELRYPSGFTPRDPPQGNSYLNKKSESTTHRKENVNGSGCSGQFRGIHAPKSGGSILQMVEDFIKVGQMMGYKIEGWSCPKDQKRLGQGVVFQEQVGISGGILCVWDPCMFHKENAMVSDNFIAIMGNWLPTNKKLLVIFVYAPQKVADKQKLWAYLNLLIGRWIGDVSVMGDFNEVRTKEERFGSILNPRGAALFNSFIVDSGLVEVPLTGYSFTWSLENASKMSRLDRFLVFEDLQRSCPNLSSLTLDRYRSDHRPILPRELNIDYGPTPFRFYHSWMAKKLRILKGHIRAWLKDKKGSAAKFKEDLKSKLSIIDSFINKGKVSSDILEERLDIMNKLSSLMNMESCELAQKAKVQWAIEEGRWTDDPNAVKKEFFSHFQNRFDTPRASRLLLDMEFPNKLSQDQASNIEMSFSKEEIKQAVWDCGLDKSPGPDSFTFGGNSYFIALIPKMQGANMVKDYRPISLIGSLYKIITKLLANRLVFVIDELVSEVQSAFISKRHILDGPFILNEIIHWCKAKKKNSMIFKVDFEKAFDFVRWDFLEDVMKNFDFGPRWCNWIMSYLKYSKGLVLVNGSPTSEFKFYKGLKQGDPLSPFLFVLVMETLHLSFQNVVNAGLFKGVLLDNSLQLTYLFYAYDVIFLGQWCTSNITVLIQVLDYFFRASGLRINIHKSKLMGVAVESSLVTSVTFHIGCSSLTAPFSYLGVNVGGHMSRIASWDGVINKVLNRISKWKMKVLSAGGRLTLLKSILGAVQLYYMSLFIAPMQVIKKLESTRYHFFNCVEPSVRKMALFKWDNVLAAKEMGGLGVLSFFALNRVLVFKWVWHFRSQGNSIWARVIKALHGKRGNLGCLSKAKFPSNWLNITRSLYTLHNKGIDLLGAIKKKVGNRDSTMFWEDLWKGERVSSFPMLQIDRYGRCREMVSFRSLLCTLAIDLYACITRWWDVCILVLSSYEDWWEWLLNLRLPSKLKALLESVFYVSWWLIWIFRNKTIFGPNPPLRARLFDDVVGFSFTWCNSR